MPAISVDERLGEEGDLSSSQARFEAARERLDPCERAHEVHIKIAHEGVQGGAAIPGATRAVQERASPAVSRRRPRR